MFKFQYTRTHLLMSLVDCMNITIQPSLWVFVHYRQGHMYTTESMADQKLNALVCLILLLADKRTSLISSPTPHLLLLAVQVTRYSYWGTMLIWVRVPVVIHPVGG